ncbi:SDR family NAD(P)-dependent oxidoreductase [Nocardioides lianchengensis]|uniref:Short-chain dehydrogenase n=1 Tax=Nocardioides lianchengensis TaxID=1045774 RepID=A0A1G6W1D4_9ACTN|nr:SDR family NAD(P)-dependent oxidoreductase [Nocardioides lianchengensis]NYG09495.1 NAD(P)-dependent dehydrogenase (short-subunit alcohol dehydrogenase family) [Nocardioides lianchengensis]SDD59057.1 Short-chain dehydrogenase [Nocardioides lianchengensis]
MTENDKRTALVTGANKGIGYEIAAGLSRLGFRVGVGARDAGRRDDAVAKLRAEGHDVFGVPLDVTDDVSVAAAAALLEEEGGLDVLVNNAAITGGMPQEPTRVSADQVREVVDTNVIGVIRVTNAVLPLLRRAASPRIVNVSSTVGSLTLQTAQAEPYGPLSAAYSPTKSYLNAITIQYAKELADEGVLVNAGCPGYVATDLNGHQGLRTPEQGAAIFLELATLPDGGPTGTFRDETGVQPW